MTNPPFLNLSRSLSKSLPSTLYVCITVARACNKPMAAAYDTIEDKLKNVSPWHNSLSRSSGVVIRLNAKPVINIQAFRCWIEMSPPDITYLHDIYNGHTAVNTADTAVNNGRYFSGTFKEPKSDIG